MCHRLLEWVGSGEKVPDAKIKLEGGEAKSAEKAENWVLSSRGTAVLCKPMTKQKVPGPGASHPNLSWPGPRQEVKVLKDGLGDVATWDGKPTTTDSKGQNLSKEGREGVSESKWTLLRNFKSHQLAREDINPTRNRKLAN